MPLRDAEPLRDEPSALERFLTFVGRPGYVVNSLLRGEPGDALENAAMFGEELVTGSWLHGKHLLGLLPSEYGGEGIDQGLTTRDERPEFADVLRSWGSPLERGSWEELGANVVGGALTDPFTYVGGIGLASKAGRVGKTAVAGLGAANEVGLAARSALTRALEASPAGARALAEAGGSAEEFMRRVLNTADAQPWARARVAEETARIAADPALQAEALRPFMTIADDLLERGPDGLLAPRPGAALPGPLDEASKAQAYADLAAKRLGIVEEAGPLLPGQAPRTRVDLTGHNAQADLLSDGLRAIEGKGLLRPFGVPTLEVPGLSWTALPGRAEQWEKIGLATPAYALKGIVGLGSPAAAEALGAFGAKTADALRKTFVNRSGFGQLPDGLTALAPGVSGRALVKAAEAQETISHLGQNLKPEALSALGTEWIRAADKFDDLAKQPGEVKAILDAARARGLTEAPDVLPGLVGDHADAVRFAYADARARAIGAAEAAGAAPEDAARFLDAYVARMREVPKELVDRGIWSKATDTPFYVPHQADDALAMFLASGSPSKKIGGTNYAEALADVYTRGRKNPRLQELLAEFNKVADRYGVPRPDLADFDTPTDALVNSGMLQSNLAELWLRREWAHAQTIARADFEKLARETVTDVRHANVLDDFLGASLQGLGARQNAVAKFLGGGKFRFNDPRLVDAAKGLQGRLGGAPGAVEGRAGWVYDWPGINSIFKPAMYLPSVSTYVRNGVGGIVMAAMDPEVGGSAAAAGLAAAIRDAPLVRELTGSKASRSTLASLIAAATDRATPEQLAKLESATVGGRKASELVQFLREGVVGSNAVNDRELFASAASIKDAIAERANSRGGLAALKRDVGAAFSGKGLTTESFAEGGLERMRAFWRPLGRVNQTVENGLRAGAFVKLVGEGWDPATALAKVRETFVDYQYQSGSERLLRDLLPFVRFTIGAGPNAIKGSTSLVGRAVGRGAVGSDDGQALPPELRQQVSIPLGGGTYATSLGLPFEAGGALLGLIPGAADWSRNAEQNVLGALGAPLKPALEKVVGEQFYSGLPLSEVKPIGDLPPIVSHALVGFLPISRFASELGKLIKTLDGDWASAVNATTGVKLRTIDGEREAERLLTRWLQKAVEDGRVGSLERFFAKKDRAVDPEVQQALEALATAEAKRRKKT